MTCPRSFCYLLEYLYCDHFLSPLTFNELARVKDLTHSLKLYKTQDLFTTMLAISKAKLEARVDAEIGLDS